MTLATLVESRLLLYAEWRMERGKLIFLLPRAAAIYSTVYRFWRYDQCFLSTQVEAPYTVHRESII
jgi:hypothetical protein